MLASVSFPFSLGFDWLNPSDIRRTATSHRFAQQSFDYVFNFTDFRWQQGKEMLQYIKSDLALATWQPG